MKENETMKFAFKNRRILINLILGIIWLGLGISYFLDEDPKLKFKPYVLTILGFGYIFFSIYEYTQKYFTITQERIKINSFPSKELNLNEIVEVKYFADDFIFKSPSKSLKIVKSQMSPDQIPQFEIFLITFKIN